MRQTLTSPQFGQCPLYCPPDNVTSKLSPSEAGALSRGVSVFTPYRSVMLGCCFFSSLEPTRLRKALLHNTDNSNQASRCVLVPRKKLLWSFVTPGNSDDEGYCDVRFIAQARLATARTQYGAHISTFPQHETLAVAWDSLVFGTSEWLPDPRLLIWGKSC